jgi:acyl-CoA thioesterase
VSLGRSVTTGAMPIDLESATTPHGGVLHVHPGWQQGKGAFGGLVVAAMMRAAEQAIADPSRTIRSVTAEIPAPVETGRAELSVEILRAGKSVTTARCALVQAGETRAHAVVIAALGRGTGSSWNTLAPPAAPPWQSLRAMPVSEQFPDFAQHFEFRIVDGIPASGSDAPLVGWISARSPGTRRDSAFVAAMIDAWYPVALVRLTPLRPMATISFTLEIVGDVTDLGDEPLLYRATSPVCADGYSFETRELWRGDRLIARNHQTFVIIK